LALEELDAALLDEALLEEALELLFVPGVAVSPPPPPPPPQAASTMQATFVNKADFSP